MPYILALITEKHNSKANHNVFRALALGNQTGTNHRKTQLESKSQQFGDDV
jgi:hypothetical protein